ncbi:hypothetical protein [Neobacillus sp. DY30]|uniref:RNA polymerase sigma factor n=1 Tax=Neobacillus sp. DY30 TaxID=3047871 RepID=UPI0024C0C69B|nr:hypothetical protein [Neobacillus sp. DY30]WHX97954.1 hypothetical protein QNH29_14805 [Neobacillus sp. DY30]
MNKGKRKLEVRLVDDLWTNVRKAAVSKNPKEMVGILYQSGFLEGLENQMRNKWRQIPPEVLDSIVIGSAVDILYEKISNGGVISNPGGYLYKVADYKAVAFIQEQKQMTTTLIKEMKLSDNFVDPFDDSPIELDREYCLKRALIEARRLLKKLGQENVQNVMAYVFDCIEAQRYDVKPAEIAKALGLSSGTVRTSLTRGFDRLKRIALEDDLANQILNEAKSITDINDEEEVV